jgi:glycerol-3-phosphate acyltransferase PlsY
VNLNLCLIFAAYFLGSIPFGWLVARGIKGVDIRTLGSGNIGASNVSRVCGRFWGRTTLVLDAAKGAGPTGFALWASQPELAAAVGLAAVLGHCWSVFLGFKGGKGVATSAGVMAVMVPWALLLALCAWLGVYRLRRQTSLAALVACGVLVGGTLGCKPAQTALCVALVAIIVWRHRENIVRLRRGEEHLSEL